MGTKVNSCKPEFMREFDATKSGDLSKQMAQEGQQLLGAIRPPVQYSTDLGLQKGMGSPS